MPFTWAGPGLPEASIPAGSAVCSSGSPVIPDIVGTESPMPIAAPILAGPTLAALLPGARRSKCPSVAENLVPPTLTTSGVAWACGSALAESSWSSAFTSSTASGETAARLAGADSFFIGSSSAADILGVALAMVNWLVTSTSSDLLACTSVLGLASSLRSARNVMRSTFLTSRLGCSCGSIVAISVVSTFRSVGLILKFDLAIALGEILTGLMVGSAIVLRLEITWTGSGVTSRSATSSRIFSASFSLASESASTLIDIGSPIASDSATVIIHRLSRTSISAWVATDANMHFASRVASSRFSALSHHSSSARSVSRPASRPSSHHLILLRNASDS